MKTTTPNDHDYTNSPFWSTRILASIIKRKYGAIYASRTSYYVLFRKASFSFHLPGKRYEKADPQAVAVWKKEQYDRLSEAFLLVQTFQQLWLVSHHDVDTEVHICCPYPASLRPSPLVASSFNLSPRFGLRILRGYFPRQLSHRTITPPACAGGLCQLNDKFLPPEQLFQATSCRTEQVRVLVK